MSEKQSTALSKEFTAPFLPIPSEVFFYPGSETVLPLKKTAVPVLQAAFNNQRLIAIGYYQSSEENQNKKFFNIASLCLIGTSRGGHEQEEIFVEIKVASRVRILDIFEEKGVLFARLDEIPETQESGPEIIGLRNYIWETLQKSMQQGKFTEGVDVLAMMRFSQVYASLPLEKFVQEITFLLNLDIEKRYNIFADSSLLSRLKKISDYLAEELKILEVENELANKNKEKINLQYKRHVLRQKKMAIEKELGEIPKDAEDDEFSDREEIKELNERLAKLQAPEEVKNKVKQEIKKIAKTSIFNPESSYVRNYLDWIFDLPWEIRTPNNTDILRAQKILEEDHYGLEKIKERIMEYLAVMKLKSHQTEKSASGPTILCFAGPPGVGKTSIGKSIARALNRKFVRVSLGGIRDEAEIRGHRRTYVGAMPGRLIQGLKQAGSKNPVFMLDEIDKIGDDFHGDPSAALLEALDPEQNNTFSDHYLDLPFDLSEVMFITTCNVLEPIPPALRDRMEVIHFASYTDEEKFHIAKKFLWPKQIEAHGLKQTQVKISDAVIKTIINRYTHEAGVRELERQLSAVLRKIARKITEKEKTKTVVVPAAKLPKYLGPHKFAATLAEKKDEIGMANGLAWTMAGGDVLHIETATMPGRGELMLTGQLGDVMKESCHAAMSYLRSRHEKFGLPKQFYRKLSIHIHVPEGAVPKDGPSAGIAITSSILSALTQRPLRKDVAMTGEITLRGNVMEIGGIKEKVLAAHRAGIKIIILPKENAKDLEEVPKNIRRELKFVLVEHMDEVVEKAFRPTFQPNILEPNAEKPPAALPKSSPRHQTNAHQPKPRKAPQRDAIV